jgi:hypothetical protein
MHSTSMFAVLLAFLSNSTHNQVLLVEWLLASGEGEAKLAHGFASFGFADGKERWILDDIFICMIPTQGLESKWGCDRNSISQGYQVGLAVYMAEMLKSMRACAKQQAADLKLAGHENFIPSTPQAVSEDWDLL